METPHLDFLMGGVQTGRLVRLLYTQEPGASRMKHGQNFVPANIHVNYRFLRSELDLYRMGPLRYKLVYNGYPHEYYSYTYHF